MSLFDRNFIILSTWLYNSYYYSYYSYYYFLLQPASANLIAYFPLKPIGVCFSIITLITQVADAINLRDVINLSTPILQAY